MSCGQWEEGDSPAGGPLSLLWANPWWGGGAAQPIWDTQALDSWPGPAPGLTQSWSHDPWGLPYHLSGGIQTLNSTDSLRIENTGENESKKKER